MTKYTTKTKFCLFLNFISIFPFVVLRQQSFKKLINKSEVCVMHVYLWSVMLIRAACGWRLWPEWYPEYSSWQREETTHSESTSSPERRDACRVTHTHAHTHTEQHFFSTRTSSTPQPGSPAPSRRHQTLQNCPYFMGCDKTFFENIQWA